MTPYRVELRPAAVRALRKLDRRDAQRVRAAISLLARDPRPPGARALRGRPGLRVRVGDYRIIYVVEDDVLLVVVVPVGHRRGVYGRRDRRGGQCSEASTPEPAIERNPHE